MADSRKREWRRRLQAWWEEYYVDNPAVWLLASPRSMVPSTSSETPSMDAASRAAVEEHVRRLLQRRVPERSKEELEARLLETRQTVVKPAWQISMPWQLSQMDVRIALGCWLACLMLMLIFVLTGWHRQLLAGPTWSMIAFMAAFLIVGFGNMAWIRSVWTIQALVSPTSGLYVGLTRLQGVHIVLGVLTYMVFSTLRLLLMGLPLMWLLGFIFSDSLWLGFRFALVSTLYLVALSVLYSVMGAIGVTARKATAQDSLSSKSFLLVFLTPISFVMLFVITRFLFRASALSVPPIWQWYTLPIWWLSLVPPLLPLTLLLIHHPLWGVPQIGFTLLIGLLLAPRAVRRVERARLQHEPEPRPDEGDW